MLAVLIENKIYTGLWLIFVIFSVMFLAAAGIAAQGAGVNMEYLGQGNTIHSTSAAFYSCGILSLLLSLATFAAIYKPEKKVVLGCSLLSSLSGVILVGILIFLTVNNESIKILQSAVCPTLKPDSKDIAKQLCAISLQHCAIALAGAAGALVTQILLNIRLFYSAFKMWTYQQLPSDSGQYKL